MTLTIGQTVTSTRYGVGTVLATHSLRGTPYLYAEYTRGRFFHPESELEEEGQ